MSDIEITGLTKRQVQLLDTMWAIDSYSDYREWKDALPESTQLMVSVLEEMINMAQIDADIDNEVESLQDAVDVLSKFT